MAFQYTRAAWTTGTLTAADLSSLDVKTVYSLDGTNGGTYSPTAKLILCGTQGVAVPGNFGTGNTAGSPVFSVNGTASSFTSSGSLTIGSQTSLTTTMTIGSSGNLTFSGTGSLTSSAASSVKIAGQSLRITDGTDPVYSPARVITNYQPAHWFTLGGDTNWNILFDNKFGEFYPYQSSQPTASNIFIHFRVPGGMTLTSVSIPVVMSTWHPFLPQVMPSIDLRLLSSLGLSPVNTSLGYQADTSPTGQAYMQPHYITVTLATPYTPRANEAIYVRLTTEDGNYGQAGLRVGLPIISGTINSLRRYV